MIVSIGQFIIVAIAAIVLPFAGGIDAASIITTIIAELFGALLGVNQFFDFIKKGSAVKVLCWAGAIVDLIIHFAVVFPEQGTSIALFIAFIGFPIGWLLVVCIYNMIAKTGEAVYDVADTTKNVTKNVIANFSPTVIFYCSSCDATYSEKSSEKVSCPKCGKPLIKTKIKVEQWREYSPEQKAEIKAQLQSERAGVSQGGPLEEEKTRVQNEQKAEKNEANSSKKKFCRKCGAQIPADSAFCPKCGEKVIDI